MKNLITSYIQNLLNKNIIREVTESDEDLSFDVEIEDGDAHYVFNDTHFGLIDTYLIEEIVVSEDEVILNNHYLEQSFCAESGDLKYIIIIKSDQIEL